MSSRMIQRIDALTVYARWVALLAVLLIVVLAPVPEYEVTRPSLWIAVGAMAALNIIPAVLVHFRVYPDYAAFGFLVLDSAFAVGLLLLGGPELFCYSFVPALACAIRFNLLVGLVDAALLAVGSVLITLVGVGTGATGSMVFTVIMPSVTLILVCLYGGLLVRHVKMEPPLNASEVRARREEMQRLRAAADRSRAIYEMAGTLSATLNYERILDAVLEISAVGFDELVGTPERFRERPASAVFLYGPEGLHVAASRSLSYEEMNIVVAGERGVLRQVLGGGEPQRLSGLTDDPELSQFAAFRRCRSAMCVPLRAGFESYGAILFASAQPEVFGPEHIELLNAVSSQAAVALANAQLYQDLVKEKERIIEVEEEARTKLARDLHDGPTQSISAIAMRLNFVRLLLGRDPQKVKDELFKLENLARRTTKEIRTMLFTLRPVVLETQGLRAAIEQLADKFKEMDDLPISIQIEDLEGKLDASIQAVAWFITQEALNNVKKYANASSVKVRMLIRDGFFVAEIVDDGGGFDVSSVMSTYDDRGSYGLRNLIERAELVNGRTTIESEPGKGTKVTLVVPLSRDAV